jgi:ornithine decarboxylase
MTMTGEIRTEDRPAPQPEPATPYIRIDLDIVRGRYAELRRLLPAAAIYYAVKANPAAPVVAALAAFGANFDIASEGELRRCKGDYPALDQSSAG